MLNQELGATLLLIAHPSKGDGTARTARGAGELSADLDVLWSVVKAEDGRRRHARCLKDRDGDLERATFDYFIEEREAARWWSAATPTAR